MSDPTPPQGHENRWLAEMGYATWRRVLEREAARGREQRPEDLDAWLEQEEARARVMPETLEDCAQDMQHAWLAAAAAIRRRVVNWKLSAEEEPHG